MFVSVKVLSVWCKHHDKCRHLESSIPHSINTAVASFFRHQHHIRNYSFIWHYASELFILMAVEGEKTWVFCSAELQECVWLFTSLYCSTKLYNLMAFINFMKDVLTIFNLTFYSKSNKLKVWKDACVCICLSFFFLNKQMFAPLYVLRSSDRRFRKRSC